MIRDFELQDGSPFPEHLLKPEEPPDWPAWITEMAAKPELKLHTNRWGFELTPPSFDTYITILEHLEHLWAHGHIQQLRPRGTAARHLAPDLNHAFNIAALFDRCTRCDQGFGDHAPPGGKCLFYATSFTQQR